MLGEPWRITSPLPLHHKRTDDFRVRVVSIRDVRSRGKNQANSYLPNAGVIRNQKQPFQLISKKCALSPADDCLPVEKISG